MIAATLTFTTVCRVGLVGCAKLKLAHRSPARSLYRSPLFVKARSWAETFCDRWFILSALHGLLNPDIEIEPYDLTLNTLSEAERRAWARRVHRQMVEAGLLVPGTRFVWLAGQTYQRELAPLLVQWPQEDPLAGMGVGQRLHWLGCGDR